MRYYKILLLTLSLICLWVLNGYADSLYTWTDDKGVTHITQDPPPPNATLKEITDYTPHPEEQNQAVRAQEKKPKKIDPDKIKAETGEVLEPEIYDEDDSDTERYRRRKRRKERRENGNNGQKDHSSDETPVKVKPEHRPHKSRK